MTNSQIRDLFNLVIATGGVSRLLFLLGALEIPEPEDLGRKQIKRVMGYLIDEHIAYVICPDCGKPIVVARGSGKGALTDDHIMPKFIGGGNEVANMQPMHQHCNVKKGCQQRAPTIYSREYYNSRSRHANPNFLVYPGAKRTDRRSRERRNVVRAKGYLDHRDYIFGVMNVRRQNALGVA